jgi:hypothetical protein
MGMPAGIASETSWPGKKISVAAGYNEMFTALTSGGLAVLGILQIRARKRNAIKLEMAAGRALVKQAVDGKARAATPCEAAFDSTTRRCCLIRALI